MDPILITGAAGRVAAGLRPHLRALAPLRLLDLVPAPDPQPGEAVVVADLRDRAALARALDGVGSVVHLAATHGHALSFEDSLDANYRGTIALLDAIRDASCRRLVYASSHHVFGLHPRDGFDHQSAPLAPDAYYGLGKAFGELACSLYAHRYGIRTLVIRIGNADPLVRDERALRIWTSARDLAKLVALGLADERVTFDVCYGGSIRPDGLFLPDPVADRLGFVPVDRALDHLAPDYLSADAMPAHLGRAFVGGAYAVVPLPEGEP
jgi:uronate dehydrogenase